MNGVKQKFHVDLSSDSIAQFFSSHDSISDDGGDSQYVTASESPDSNHGQYNDVDATTIVAIKIKYDLQRNQLTTNFNGKRFDIYYLDLYMEEYERLEAMLSKSVMEISMHIRREFIVFNEDQFCVQRLPTLLRANISFCESQFSTKDITVIAFASTNAGNNNNIMVKYNERFYFAGQSLIDEYLDLLGRTDYPMGTPIRLNAMRVVANETEHTLDVISREQFPVNQQVIIIERLINTASKWRSFIEGTNLKRYMKMPADKSLCALANELLYWEDNGGCDEIYAETDYVVGSDDDNGDVGPISNGNGNVRATKKAPKTENGRVNHSNRKAPAERGVPSLQDTFLDVDGFQKVVSKTERRRHKEVERNRYLVPGQFRK